MKKSLNFYFLIMVSCVTNKSNFNNSPKSEWATLKDTAKVSCSPLPMGEEDIENRKVKLTAGNQRGFIIEALNRRGQTTYYYISLGDVLKNSSKLLKEITIVGENVLLGGFFDGKQFYYVVSNANQVEVYSSATNVKVNQSSMGRSVTEFPDWLEVKSGYWLSLQNDEEDEKKQDDESYDQRGLLFLEKDGSGKGIKSVRKIEKIKFENLPILIAKQEKESIVGIMQNLERSKKENEISFKLKEIDVVGNIKNQFSASWEGAQTLETRTANYFNDQYVFAFIEGDSLVGSASLKFGVLQNKENGGSIQLVATKTLEHEHIADPNWVSMNGKLHLLIPKWVDEETTVASYSFDGKNIVDEKNHGIFPTGTSLQGVFYDEVTKKIYITIRYRSNSRWQYDVCGLDGLK